MGQVCLWIMVTVLGLCVSEAVTAARSHGRRPPKKTLSTRFLR
uniref:Uncharacterized protein n=1 Tax=Anguilla anguilla TaxID=7936 RepID=A0A0E9P5E2_ANGAN